MPYVLTQVKQLLFSSGQYQNIQTGRITRQKQGGFFFPLPAAILWKTHAIYRDRIVLLQLTHVQLYPVLFSDARMFSLVSCMSPFIVILLYPYAWQPHRLCIVLPLPGGTRLNKTFA